MAVETVGLARDRIGEDPEIITEALGHDIKMPAGFFRLSAMSPIRSGEGQSQPANLRFDRPETTINGLEPAVYRSLELGDSHRLAALAHFSIVGLRG